MDPAQIVVNEFDKRGLTIDQGLAKAIATALYSAYEQTFSRRVILPRVAWEDVSYKNGYLENVQADMIREVVKNGWLPAALPAIKTVFTQHMFPVLSEREWLETDEGWDNVKIEFLLKVRRAYPSREYRLQPKVGE